VNCALLHSRRRHGGGGLAAEGEGASRVAARNSP
jgi:hypothetical protein